jgi:hypothetical protein
MLTGFLHLHSSLRYLLLIVLVVSIVNAFLKMQKKAPFTAADNKLSLATFILTHTQLLLGLVLYFFGAKGFSYIKMGLDMGDSVMRFYAVEHLVGMLIAIVLISLGRIKAKKLTDDVAKHKTHFVYFLIGLIIIIASIPWPFRGLGTNWI